MDGMEAKTKMKTGHHATPDCVPREPPYLVSLCGVEDGGGDGSRNRWIHRVMLAPPYPSGSFVSSLAFEDACSDVLL